MVGERLGGRYRVVRLISTSAAVDVFEAQDERLPRRVAVRLGHADRPLDNPDLARVLDGGEHEGVPYVVMELVDGPTRVVPRPRDPTTVLPVGLVPSPEPSPTTAAGGSTAPSGWSRRAVLGVAAAFLVLVLLMGLAARGDGVDVPPSTVPVTAEPPTTLAPTTTTPPTTEAPPEESRGKGKGHGRGSDAGEG
jgi:hypothetical protein